MPFRVELDFFRGPMDLLLYLVRKHELDATDIPVALVIDQYLEHLSVLEQIDVNAVGDFLELASTLIEIKSRLVLPRVEEPEEELEDPRNELVRRLLEFKEYRDAASMLEERGRQWRARYPRLVDELPNRQHSPADQPIHEVELWDLVSAFGRVMRQQMAAETAESIRYDDTPIHVHMQQIHERLINEDRVAFLELFEGLVHRATLVGKFLAVLELIRHDHARAWQEKLFDEIWLERGACPLPDRLDMVADYEHASVDQDVTAS